MGEFEELRDAPKASLRRAGGLFCESHRAADGVLLTYDDAQRDPIIFALAEVR